MRRRVTSKEWQGYGLSQWETTLHCNVVSHWLSPYPEWAQPMKDDVTIILGSANERQRYIVTSSLIGWTHTQNDPYTVLLRVNAATKINHVHGGWYDRPLGQALKGKRHFDEIFFNGCTRSCQFDNQRWKCHQNEDIPDSMTRDTKQKIHKIMFHFQCFWVIWIFGFLEKNRNLYWVAHL